MQCYHKIQLYRMWEVRAIHRLHSSLLHESDILQYQITLIPLQLYSYLFTYTLSTTDNTWSNYAAFLKRPQVFPPLNNKERVHLYGLNLNCVQVQSLIYLEDWHSRICSSDHRTSSLNWERFIAGTDWANPALHWPTNAKSTLNTYVAWI